MRGTERLRVAPASEACRGLRDTEELRECSGAEKYRQAEGCSGPGPATTWYVRTALELSEPPPQAKETQPVTSQQSQYRAELSIYHMLLNGPKHGVNVLGLPLGVTRLCFCTLNSCFLMTGSGRGALLCLSSHFLLWTDACVPISFTLEL